MRRFDRTTIPTALIIALAVTAFMSAARLGQFRLGQDMDLFYRLETAALDAEFKLRGTVDPGREVAIVAIDEKSLKEQGRWPWTREKQAQLITAIAATGAKVIGVDVIYTEPASDDALMAHAIQRAGNVVLAFPLHVAKGRRAAADGKLPVPAVLQQSRFMVVRRAHAGTALAPYAAYDFEPPAETIAQAARALGHVYFIPDPDGIMRHEYAAVQYGESSDIYPSFALEVSRVALGISKERMVLVLGEAVQLGERTIPIDQKARILINYPGRERTFEYVSAADVLAGGVPAEKFHNRVVLIGTTALGTYDQKATPFSANFPGIEKNASVVENILHGRYLHQNIWTNVIDLGVILILGIGLALVLVRFGAPIGAAVTAAVLIGYAAAAYWLFAHVGMWLDVVYPTATVILTYVGITASRLVTEEQRAKQIRAMFSSYVSPVVVEELIRDPSKAAVGGQHKDLTMLFCDLIGFTAFSETQNADVALAQLNDYLSAMTEVIFHWHGTVDKYVGDGIVAFWGAPLEQPDHAELGIKCALHMRKRLGELQEKWRREGKPALDCGIGMNTGIAIVGNIGAEGKKLNYTMIGDQVNLAARVQELTRDYHSPIIVTEFTAARLKRLLGEKDRDDNRGRLGHVALRNLGTIKIRGRAQTVGLYALESLSRGEESRVDEGGAVLPAARPVS